MPLTSAERADVILKSLALAGAGIGAFSTIFTWSVDRESRRISENTATQQHITTAKRESQQPFLERQLNLYIEASDTAALIASLDDGPARQAALIRFWQLYWGSLAVVEDQHVESAMVEFGRLLESSSDKTTRESLKHAALKIAHSCRSSISASWDYELGPLPSKL